MRDNKNHFIYRFIDKRGAILYVGKTNNIKTRMLQHFDEKKEWVKDIARAEYKVYSCQSTRDMMEIYHINECKAIHNKACNNGHVNIELRDEGLWNEIPMDIISNPKKYRDACRQLSKRDVLPLSMGSETIATFYYLVKLHLGFDNVLLTREKGKTRFATLDDLCVTLNCKKRQTYRRIKCLLDNDIMIKAKSADGIQYYVVNPVYALFGHRISFRTYMDFRKHIAEYLTENTKMNMDALVSYDEETRNRLIRDNNE